MDKAMMSLIFAAIIFILVFFLLKAAKKHTKILQALWLRLAKEMNWEALPKPTNIPWWQDKPIFEELTDRNKRLSLRYEVRGSGKSRVAYVVFNMALPSRSNWTLRLSQEHLFTTIGKTFGMQDIIIQDEEFDKFFLVKSNDEGAAKMALADKNIRQRLMQYWDNGSLLMVKDGTLHYEQLFLTFKEDSLDVFKERFYLLMHLNQLWRDI